MHPKLTSQILAVVATLTLATTTFASPLENARAALAKNDLATAEALLTPLVAAEKPAAAACHQLGLVRQRQDRFEEAVDLFERASTLDPTTSEYFSSLGIALSQRMSQVGMMKGAMLAMRMKHAFTKALALDSKNLSALIGLARFHTNAPEIAGGSATKAREFAGRLKQANPFLGELEFGTIAEHFEEYATAATHYQAAAQLAPENAGAHLAAGRVLAQLDRPADARRHLETAQRLNPSDPHASSLLAKLTVATAPGL